MYSVLLITVVVGSVTPTARYCVSYVRARAVPLSFIRISIFSPCDGEPQGLLNFNAPACAVITNSLQVAKLREVPVSVV